jgi:nicotinamide-nucleotide amidase
MSAATSDSRVPRRAPRRPPAPAGPPLGRLLSIGDEVVRGRLVDTNAAHIARWMTDHGLAVDLVQQVGDGQAATAAALARAAAGAAVVVVTGGLGPTDDDRTRHALAEAMGVALREDAACWRAIRRWFASARRPIPAVNRRQALLPEGASALENDRGTAPGMLARLGTAWVACLPGVPHEMKAMLERLGRRLPRLAAGLKPPTVAELWLSGLGESTAQELIPGLLTERHPMVGITVNELGHLTLRVVGTPREVRQRREQLATALTPYLLPEPGLAPSLVGLLIRHRAVVTTAESCTCGHIAAALGAVPGASRVLREALVAYAPAVKSRRLGVDPGLIQRHGVVSEEVAVAMAEGALAASEADLAIASTGVAGPSGGTPACPVGTVVVAVADRAGSQARRHKIEGDRSRIQRRGAAYGLQLAWERWRTAPF